MNLTPRLPSRDDTPVERPLALLAAICTLGGQAPPLSTGSRVLLRRSTISDWLGNPDMFRTRQIRPCRFCRRFRRGSTALAPATLPPLAKLLLATMLICL